MKSGKSYRDPTTIEQVLNRLPSPCLMFPKDIVKGGLIDKLFVALWRVQRAYFLRRVDFDQWNKDLSQAVDCLIHLIESFEQIRKKT